MALSNGVKMPKGSSFICPADNKTRITLDVDGSEYIDPECIITIMAAKAYQHGVLPEPGALFDQPYDLIEAIQFCVSEQARHEQE